MPTLLHLDASARRSSTSRRLSADFARRWHDAHPDGQVIYRDLAAEPLPHVDEVAAEALLYKTAPPEAAAAPSVVLAEQLMDELRRADLLLIGAPMYNFTVPSSLKAWIDHVVWPGHTVGEDQGLLTGLPAVIVLTRMGGYSPGSPREGLNFHDAYLTAILGLMGITDIEFIVAELTMLGEGGTPEPRAAGSPGRPKPRSPRPSAAWPSWGSGRRRRPGRWKRAGPGRKGAGLRFGGPAAAPRRGRAPQ